MKRLVGEIRHAENDHGFSRRDFLKAGALGLAALATGCAATIRNFEKVPDPPGFQAGLLTPAMCFFDPTASKVRIYGTEVPVLYLPKPTQELINSSEAAKTLEDRNGSTYKVVYRVEPVKYSGILRIYKDKVSEEFLNAMPPENRRILIEKGVFTGEFKDIDAFIEMAYTKEARRTLGMTFPYLFDLSPQFPDRPGVRMYDMEGYAALVKKAVGVDIDRVRFLFYEQNRLFTAYAIPIDANGQILTRYNGGILAFGFSAAPDIVSVNEGFYSKSGMAFLHESK